LSLWTAPCGIYGELTFNLLGVFADFENELRRERQVEGILKAKVAGRNKGRSVAIIGTAKPSSTVSITSTADAKRNKHACASDFLPRILPQAKRLFSQGADPVGGQPFEGKR
jgi:DNA invertase Pin-like site-specific DNA recombinase